ncbi:DinB family protein [Crossiella sp. CA-258035]|uniref:DinB family protein n=1 Tax=Crossiella sp. CA-258035 TaxID=2981138 RepID=UPI0024BC0153|nr:DinB family protein [Crossiella sp. CA-258035]WHT21358.1 DinB family protein [Crossiella sp. CA-258035]
MTDTRPEPPLVADERDTLCGFLDFLRATVVLKATGLSEVDARKPLIPSSPLMTVIGLVNHLRWVEWAWFSNRVDDQPGEPPWAGEDPDAEFRVPAEQTLADVLAGYERECAVSREVLARKDLSATFAHPRLGNVSVRWVLTHMIEETGRHAGHLDLIRELLDGVTGE